MGRDPMTPDEQARYERALRTAQASLVAVRQAVRTAAQARGRIIVAAVSAGMSKYRVAKVLGVSRHAVDEAIERADQTPGEV